MLEFAGEPVDKTRFVKIRVGTSVTVSRYDDTDWDMCMSGDRVTGDDVPAACSGRIRVTGDDAAVMTRLYNSLIAQIKADTGIDVCEISRE